jgi:DNA-binding beta-propeller fold protein YncE
MLTLACTGTVYAPVPMGGTVEDRLDAPTALVIDGQGKLYVADVENDFVFRINPATRGVEAVARQLSRVIGDTTIGDGGPATRARLDRPMGLAFDSDGNLYIADHNNGRVRKVDARTGRITTVAGSCEYVMVVDSLEGQPRPTPTSSSGPNEHGWCSQYTVPKLTGRANSAILRSPSAVALDRSDNLYIADSELNRVLMVNARSGRIKTFAGTGAEGFAGDFGPAKKAKLDSPRDIAVDSAGNVFIADSSNYRVRRVDARTGIIITAAGNGLKARARDGAQADETAVGVPYQITLDLEGNLYIADSSNNLIYRVDSETNVLTFAFDAGPERVFNDIVVDNVGNMYIAEEHERLVYSVSLETKLISGYILRGQSD